MGGNYFHRSRRSLDVASSWGKLEYSGWADEGMSWKEDCYLGDWSYLDELRVQGPDALRFFSDFAVNSFERFAVGQAKHVIFCNSAGKVIGEGILSRFGAEDFEFNARGPVMTWLEYNFGKGDYRATAACLISKFKFQVSGPKSLFVLEKLAGENLRDIGFMHFRPGRIQGRDVSFLRQGMAGEIGFEVHGPTQFAKEISAAILVAGAEFNIRRMGSRTAMINHLEAGFPTVTHDYIPAICEAPEREYFERYDAEVRDDTSPEWFRSFERCLKVKGSFEAEDFSAWYRSPVELGWLRNVKFDHPFYGRAALESEVAKPRRTIVSLEWNAEDVLDVHASLFRPGRPYDFMDVPRPQWFCMYASKVMQGERLVGVATSRGYSYYFRRVLSHCVIDVALAKPGTEVTVIWGDPGSPQKAVRATVAAYPYKKDNRRADLDALPVYPK